MLPFFSRLLYHKHKMNPQQPGGLPPQQPQPLQPAPPQPTGPIPGPQQQYGTATTAESQTPYEFIMNPAKPPRKPLLSGMAGGSLMTKIAVFGGGAVVLIMLIVVVSSVLGSRGSNLQPLVSAGQDQTELIRIATFGIDKAVDQRTKNSAISIRLSLLSDNQALVTYLANNGQKVDGKILGLKKDARTDTQLNQATAASNFDPVFMDVLQKQLTTYQRNLKTAYASTAGPKGKTLLNNEYKAAALLLTQTKQQ